MQQIHLFIQVFLHFKDPAQAISREIFSFRPQDLDKPLLLGFFKASRDSCRCPRSLSPSLLTALTQGSPGGSSLQDCHLPRVPKRPRLLEAQNKTASPQGCSLPWPKVEDAVLAPLHLFQGFVDADGDVVVLPFAHDEFHVFAVEPGAAAESFQVNCSEGRGQDRTRSLPNQGKVGSEESISL